MRPTNHLSDPSMIKGGMKIWQVERGCVSSAMVASEVYDHDGALWVSIWTPHFVRGESLRDANVVPNTYNNNYWFATEEDARAYADTYTPEVPTFGRRMTDSYFSDGMFDAYMEK